jgi:undecaprenyldiphospho-muramoylpentapeptide beta-N-acetylglucosaminyltransferase
MPALAVARALVARGHEQGDVLFVGSRRGMEGQLVPAAGFPIRLLPGRGVARRLTWDNLAAVGGLALALGQAFVLLARRRPAVVVAVGGYASVPCALGAAALRIPLVVAEQNSVPGLANRLASRFAAASAVAFPGTPLRNAVVTGNPVRPEMTGLDRSPEGRRSARTALGLPPDAVVVVAAGGSLGSARINEAVVGLAAMWRDRPGVAIRHVTGRRDHDAVAAAVPESVDGGLVYQVVDYEDRMDLLYAAADIAVQRAGAGTIFELAAAGLASVIVPLPGAPGDHQSSNAAVLEELGGAVVVSDAELSAARLAEELDPLVADASARHRMGRAAGRLARPDAADRVAAIVEEHARA